VTWSPGLRNRTSSRPTARTRVGRRIDDSLDPAINTDGVDHGLPKNLVASGPREALPGPGIHQPESEGLIVDRDHLSVLTQHDPSEPPLRLHSLQNLRPQPPDVPQPHSPTSSLTGLRSLGGLRRLGGRRRCTGLCR
jgi:hypothetical protein